MSLVKGLVGAAIGFAVAWGLTAAAQGALGTTAGGTAGFVFGYVGALLGWLMGVGMWRAWGREWFGRTPHLDMPPKGASRYLRFNTDHKVIGVQYLLSFVVVFLLAGALAMVVRYELIDAAATLDPDIYNRIMSLHGILMVAVAVAALLGGFGNYFVPLMIGARDMAFPRLNALSYWLIPPVAVLLLSAPFAGGWDTGWTAYPPLSVENAFGQVLFILAIITFGLSSVLGGLNAITTITRMRARGMGWFQLPIFVWSVLAASAITLLFTQFFAASLLMVLLDRTAGTVFFESGAGGKPLLYQHLFWFYSHPAVYVMILPGFGLTLEVITHFSRKPLFAYKLVVAAFGGIVVLSGIVWAHHMFTSGMASWLDAPFMVLTEMISIPTGIIFLAAIGTLWEGRIWLDDADVVRDLRGAELHDRRHHRHLPRRRGDRPAPAGHVLRGRAFPLHDRGRGDLRDVRGALLLVPEDDGAHVQRTRREASRRLDVPRIRPHLHPAVHGRGQRHEPTDQRVHTRPAGGEPIRVDLGVPSGSRVPGLRRQHADLDGARAGGGSEPLAGDHARVADVVTASAQRLRPDPDDRG